MPLSTFLHRPQKAGDLMLDKPAIPRRAAPNYSTAREPNYSTAREPNYSTAREPNYSTAREPNYSTARGALYPGLAITLYLIGLPFSSLSTIGSLVAGLTRSTLSFRKAPSWALLLGV
jgi:hypothetical protein